MALNVTVFGLIPSFNIFEASFRMYIDLRMLKREWKWFERFHLAGEVSYEYLLPILMHMGNRVIG
jgi:hypothetical protein